MLRPILFFQRLYYFQRMNMSEHCHEDNVCLLKRSMGDISEDRDWFKRCSASKNI